MPIVSCPKLQRCQILFRIQKNLNEIEKQTIVKALKDNKGNITKTARDLGIHRNALYRRMEKYGL